MDINRLVSKTFPDKGERQLVQALVSALPRTITEDRTVALIHELARPAPEGQSGQQSAAYIASFIGAIGGMEHEQEAFTRWVDAGGPGAFPDESVPVPEETGDEGAPPSPMPAAPPVPSGPTRADLQEKAARHQRDMAAAPGSEGWTRYWRGGGQADYLATLRAMDTAPADPAA